MRFVLGDIVEDQSGNLGVIAFVSLSGNKLLVEYANENFEMHIADTLTLNTSAFAASSRKREKQVKLGRLSG